MSLIWVSGLSGLSGLNDIGKLLQPNEMTSDFQTSRTVFYKLRKLEAKIIVVGYFTTLKIIIIRHKFSD